MRVFAIILIVAFSAASAETTEWVSTEPLVLAYECHELLARDTEPNIWIEMYGTKEADNGQVTHAVKVTIGRQLYYGVAAQHGLDFRVDFGVMNLDKMSEDDIVYAFVISSSGKTLYYDFSNSLDDRPADEVLTCNVIFDSSKH